MYDFASTMPSERKRVRLPIVINGAGPAGLLLAIGLKNAKIPFEICEKRGHDMKSRGERNHISLLSRDMRKPLKDFLKVENYMSFLKRVALNPSKIGLDARKYDQVIHNESLLGVFREHVKVNYGYRLESEGISSLESVITPKYIVGANIRTFPGSLLVGADGIFSAGKACTPLPVVLTRYRLIVRHKFNLWAWPAITYFSTVSVSREHYESEFSDIQGRNNNTTSQLFGNTRLLLTTNRIAPGQVHLSLWYSRKARSEEDYREFFGLKPDESDTPRVD